MRVPTRRLKTSQRKQAVAFVAIALFVTCAVSLPILLVALSSRPDLYSVKPKPTKPGVAALDWESLGDLLHRRLGKGLVVGDRLDLGDVELVVRDVHHGRVHSIGLELETRRKRLRSARVVDWLLRHTGFHN